MHKPKNTKVAMMVKYHVNVLEVVKDVKTYKH